MSYTAPRTWIAGEVVTAAMLNQQIRDNLLALNGYVLKGSDESRTSTIALSADAALSYTIAAAGTYLVDLYLWATSAANAAGDISLGFSFPAGTMHMAGQAASGGLASGSAATGEWAGKLSLTSSSTSSNYGLSTSIVGIHVHGILIATGTGTLQLVWAQRASSASASTVKAGSHMTVRQVA
jgi:hypothetical protein